MGSPIPLKAVAATGPTPEGAVPVQVFELSIPAGAAPTASPAFSGNPTAPTPAVGDNDTSIATTAFVNAATRAKTQVVAITADTASVAADLPTLLADHNDLVTRFNALVTALKA